MPVRVASWTVDATGAVLLQPLVSVQDERVIVQRLQSVDAAGNQQFQLTARLCVFASLRAMNSLAPVDTADFVQVVSQPDMRKDPLALVYDLVKAKYSATDA